MLTTRSKIAIARSVQRPLMFLRRAVGLGPEAFVTRSGIHWHLDLREGIDFSIYLLGAFERSTIAAYTQLVRSGSVALDIGANIGAHTMFLARLVGAEGRVIAFEPTDWAFSKLSENLALNPDLKRRVLARQAMLVDRAGKAPESEIYASWPLAGGEGLHPRLRGRAMSARNARATTLDLFLEEAGVERVDFIKLDVDGYECRVLDGGMRTLTRYRPVIITELSPYILEERGDSVDKLLDLFKNAGYRLARLESRSPLPENRALICASIPEGAGYNVIAIPHRRAPITRT